MSNPRLAFLALAVVAFAAGCGESCPTGTADVENMPSSCSLAANQTVTMFVNLCPHCNETSPQCEVDTDSAATTREIFLNTFWELCEENQDCPAGGCDVGGVACTFSVPAGEYTVISANGPSSVINVAPAGSTTCGTASSALASF
jgi:hypothetical protein